MDRALGGHGVRETGDETLGNQGVPKTRGDDEAEFEISCAVKEAFRLRGDQGDEPRAGGIDAGPWDVMTIVMMRTDR